MNKLIFVTLLVCIFIEFAVADGENSNDNSTDDFIGILDSKIFGQPDKNVGKKLKNWKPGQGNPEELGSYFQGDILIPEKTRNGVSATYRWPKGQIPYVITNQFDRYEKSIIRKAIAEYHANTCIRFIARTTHKNYVSIQKTDTGCWSTIGRAGGKQFVNLQAECLEVFGTVLHELYHAAGFYHEHVREDRDDYVIINWQNIEPSMAFNFKMVEPGTTSAFGIPYNYGSVMHYSSDAFSTNYEPTIVAKYPGGDQMGQREGFAMTDIRKINRMYKCKLYKQ